MKKVLYMFMILALGLTQACEGPEGDPGPQGEQGPAGPQGPQGPAGTSSTATVYDCTGWNFTADEDWQLGLSFFDDQGNALLEVNESDAILVYRLLGAYEGEDGEQVPVWEPLPATYFEEAGMFQYGFLTTPYELLIYMQGQLDLSTLEAGFTTDQIFRIVVVPADYGLRTANGAKPKADLSKYPVDFNKYEEVAEYFKISENNIKTIKLK